MLLALLLALLPVRPVTDAPKLVREAGQGRPAVLHFFATWCDACREELPRLRPAFRALPRQNVGLLFVSIDTPDKNAAVEEMLARYELEGLPALLLEAPDPDPVAKAVGEKHWDGTLPATFVFDAKGKLVKSFIGRTDARALQAAVSKAGK